MVNSAADAADRANAQIAELRQSLVEKLGGEAEYQLLTLWVCLVLRKCWLTRKVGN